MSYVEQQADLAAVDRATEEKIIVDMCRKAHLGFLARRLLARRATVADAFGEIEEFLLQQRNG